jgi:hypothetical protein
MRTITLLALLAIAAPAVAQSRVYTNDDLVNGPVRWTRTASPEDLRGLEANQFRLPAPRPSEAQVVGVFSSPTAGPFGEFPQYPTLRVTDEFYGSPFFGSPYTTWPLGYVGSYGHGRRGVRSVTAPISPAVPVPPPVSVARSVATGTSASGSASVPGRGPVRSSVRSRRGL